MSKTDPRKLVCTACKHENEIERVYCHNCGEKLDRSLIPQLDETQSAEASAKAGKKVKQMMNPNRFAWVRTVKTFVLMEIFAAVVAAGFLALQAPENVPDLKADRSLELEAADKVKGLWEDMIKQRITTSPRFTVTDINHYLRRNVKSAEGSLGIKFDRAFVHFEPGLVTVATQRNAWGLPLYNSATFKPTLEGGKWSADIRDFAMGRLTIPKGIAKLVKLDGVILDPLTKVFEKEIRQLERVEKIEPGENVILFVTKPAQ